MATINDVARLAGVSRGTVSNVLNGIQVVSPEKVERVLAAVKATHYVPDAAARSLKTNRTNRVAVVLPNIVSTGYARLFSGVERVLDERGYSASLSTTSDVPAKENQILQSARENRIDGLILATCQPESTETFQRLEALGLRLLFVEREPLDPRFSFLGYDDSAALDELLASRLRAGIAKIALLAGPPSFSAERAIREAWERAHDRAGRLPDHGLVCASNLDKESSFKLAMRLFRTVSPEVVVTTTTQTLEGVMKAVDLSVFPGNQLPELISIGETSWSDHGFPQALLLRRPSTRVGEMAADLMIEGLENPALTEERRVLLPTMPPARPPAGEHAGGSAKRPLRIAMLEGEAFDATSLLAGEYQRRTGQAIELHAYQYSEVWEVIQNSDSVPAYDLVELDIPWLEEFARSGKLLSLEPFLKDGAFKSRFFDQVPDYWWAIDGVRYGIPYKFGSQMLFYRKDLFEDPVIRSRFYSRHKVELRPPRSWKEYNLVASFFTRSLQPESPVPWGTTLGGRNFSGAVGEFLPRKWSYEADLDLKPGLVPLSTPGAVQALANYVECYQYAAPGSEDFWWDEENDQFAAGEAAMMVMFEAHATKLTDPQVSRVLGKIGFAPVPGGRPVQGGWSLGIPARTGQAEAAFAFVDWITRSEVAVPHTILGGSTPTVELTKSSELINIFPWVPQALNNFRQSRARAGVGRPDGTLISEHTLEKILGDAIHRALSGRASPREALEQADLQVRLLKERSSEGGGSVV